MASLSTNSSELQPTATPFSPSNLSVNTSTNESSTTKMTNKAISNNTTTFPSCAGDLELIPTNCNLIYNCSRWNSICSANLCHFCVGSQLAPFISIHAAPSRAYQEELRAPIENDVKN